MAEEAKTSDKALFFVLGAFIGAATALFLAPRSGEETRRLIAAKTRESRDLAANRSKEIVDKTSGIIDRGKDMFQQQRDSLSAALQAGKQAYREEKKEKADI